MTTRFLSAHRLPGAAGLHQDAPTPAPLDVADQPPTVGLSRAGALPRTSSSAPSFRSAPRQVRGGGQRAALAAGPPTRARPVGAPATVATPASQRYLGPSGRADRTDSARCASGSERPTPERPVPPVPTNAPTVPAASKICPPAEGEGMDQAGAAAMTTP